MGKLVKRYLIILVGIVFLSCNKNIENVSAEKLWQNAQNYRKDKKLKESISNFKLLVKRHSDNDLASKAQFQIADIYLNDTKDFEYAIFEFKQVIKNYPNHEVAKKSLFMVAYIYNNYLEAYSDAIINYKLFKEKYPQDELIPSVIYELEGLKSLETKIDSLNFIRNNNSNI